jgi:DNA primase
LEGVRVNPGQEAAHKNIKEYLSDIQVYNLVLPMGNDPDDCTKEELDNAMSDAKKIKNIFTLDLC